MNFRIIGKYLGYLLLAEAAFMLPAALAAGWYGEWNAVNALLLGAAACAAAGFALFLPCRKAAAGMYVRESFVVAGGGWVLMSLLGALPFYFSREIPRFIDAFFETVSGFTTTGASILTNVEAMSRGLLFWRSFTHWLGGIGVLAFILAIVRSQSGTGFTLHLLRAEAPGPQVGKISPKTRQSVRILFAVYLSLSALNLVFLLAGGMPMFDAFCTMFGTAGTGGFGIKNDSMASYSLYLQIVTTVFMMLFGINFSLYYLLARKEWKAARKDEELRLFLGIFAGAVLVITLSLVLSGAGGAGRALHDASFAVSSILTTTGFATVDFNFWPEIARALLVVLMIFGAMAGSTGGGFKMARLLILLKNIKAGLHRVLHPRSVKTVRVNGKSLDENVTAGVVLFLSVYCGIAILSVLLVAANGFSFETSVSAVISCFNNIGPGLDVVGPTGNYAQFSVFSKLVLSVDMLLGRLEIFPLLLLFFPSTWRKKA